MVAVLAKAPATVAPWPPQGRDLEPREVLPGEDFGAFCARNKVAFKDLMLKNFQIDIKADKNWEMVCNWYLYNKVGCRSLTPRGNCKFVGGEILYVPVTKWVPMPKVMRNGADIVQWFMSEVLPKRTIGPGSVTNGYFMLKRGGKVLDRLMGKEPDPNGICGSAAEYVIDRYEDLGRQSLTVGYILWLQEPFFTHVANVIMPVPIVFGFQRDERIPLLIGAPRKPPSWKEASQWTVLDLYYMKVGTVEQWWKHAAYMGTGKIILDPDGQYINS
jgi:hypothetical protein